MEQQLRRARRQLVHTPGRRGRAAGGPGAAPAGAKRRRRSHPATCRLLRPAQLEARSCRNGNVALSVFPVASDLQVFANFYFSLCSAPTHAYINSFLPRRPYGLLRVVPCSLAPGSINLNRLRRQPRLRFPPSHGAPTSGCRCPRGSIHSNRLRRQTHFRATEPRDLCVSVFG